jgi:hypothetical protein
VASDFWAGEDDWDVAVALWAPEGRWHVGLVKALFQGSLDFRAELLHRKEARWTTPLPVLAVMVVRLGVRVCQPTRFGISFTMTSE